MTLGRRIGLGVLGIVGLFLLGGLILPKSFKVVRVATVDAPVAIVFDEINDLRKVQDWSVWREKDPAMVIQLGEVTKGEGAGFTWTSDVMGAGSWSTTRVEINKRIQIHLEMALGPADASFILEPEGDKTQVRWTMWGDEATPILGPYLSMMMDSAVGPDFEQGLALLDTASRKAKAEEGRRLKAEQEARDAAAARKQAATAEAQAMDAVVSPARAAPGGKATPPPR